MAASPIALAPSTLHFTLDLSAARVCLQLRDAGVGPLRVPLVALEVPVNPRPVGPEQAAVQARPLRNGLARLVVELRERELAQLLRPHGIAVRLRTDGARLTWSEGGVRVTARARLFPDDGALPTGPGLLLSIDDVRVFGRVARSWPAIVAERLAALPPWLAAPATRVGGTVVAIDVVRSALRGVLPPAGWKLPDSASTHVLALNHEDGLVTTELGDAGPGRPLLPSSFAGRSLQRAVDRLEFKRANSDLEAAAAGDDRANAVTLLRRRLETPGDGGPYVAGRFLQVAIAEPVLHGQCRAVAEQRLAENPEDGLAWAILLAVGEQAGDAAAATTAALRLGAMAEEAGEPFELVAATCAAARLTGVAQRVRALDLLRRAARRCPDEPDLLREMAGAATTLGEAALSRELRQRLLLADLGPQEASAVAVELGREACEGGQVEAALTYVDFARARTPDALAVHELAADVAARSRDTRAEREALERLTAVPGASDRPDVAARAWHRLAGLAPTDDAVALAHMAHVLAPDDPTYAMALAEARERTGDAGGALALWTQLATTGDISVQAKAAIHTAALAATDPSLRALARGRLLRVLEAEPAHLEALDALALLATEPRTWNQVLEAHERGARAARGATAARLHQTVGLLREERLGLLHDAIEAYELAIDADPDGGQTSASVERLTRLYEHLGRWEALAALLVRTTRIARDEDERVAARLRLARLLAGPMGRPDEALRHLLELAERRPRDLAVLRATAALLRDATATQDGADETRLRALLRLAALAPQDERELAAIEAAEILTQRGAHAEAEAILSNVGRARPRIGEALARLAARSTPAAAAAPPAPDRGTGIHDEAIATLAPRVLCDAPDPESAELLCELLEAAGRTDELAAVRAHLSSTRSPGSP